MISDRDLLVVAVALSALNTIASVMRTVWHWVDRGRE